MPRFENERVNPEKNINMDRTVPESENYYGGDKVDLNMFSPEERNIVTDNQTGINPCTDFEEPYQNTPQPIRRQATQPVQRSRPPKKKKSKLSAGKVIVALILVMAIVGIGTVASALGRMTYDEKLENKYVNAAELKSDKGVKNILLLGVDARPDDETSSSRSDTMMLVSVDTVHNCIKMVSFLRDTWCYIPALGYDQRLNAACSAAGYQGVVDAIEYNFGVKIDGYAVVDFEMFKVLVDSIGGVKVDVTQEEADEVTDNPYRYGDVVLKAGEYKLTGEQALAYCRIRKIDTDWKRTERQRTVMQAIISGAKRNPLALFKMAVKAAPYVETNIKRSELISIGMSAIGCIGNIHQTKVPFDDTWEYATIQGNSVIAINRDKNKEMLIDYIYNKTSDDIKAQEENSD